MTKRAFLILVPPSYKLRVRLIEYVTNFRNSDSNFPPFRIPFLNT